MKKILLALFLFASFSNAQDDYSTWGYQRTVSLNTTASGANVATNQPAFPVLVRLTSAQGDVFTGSKGRGADIRFAKTDGTHLAYQIERWDSVGQQAEIWVSADVAGNNNAQQMFLYWGKVGAADSSRGASVFNSFRGVWHLNASVGDATANANNGIDSGSVDTAGGAIGRARTFNNPLPYVTNGKYISLGSPATLNISRNITMEAWVKWAQRDGHRIIVCHGSTAGVAFETVLRIGEYKDYRTGVWTGTVHHAFWDSTHLAPDSATWVHLAGVYTGTAWNLYRNGALVATTVDTNGAKATPGNWRIGGQSTGTPISRYFHGAIDEVRISNVTRSADWLRLGYENQKGNQSLVALGPTQIVTGIKGFTGTRILEKRLKMDGYRGTPLLWIPPMKPVDPKGRRILPMP